MNARAHTHQPELVNWVSPWLSYKWYVKYGDTRVFFHRQWAWQGDPHSWPAEKQEMIIGAAVRKAILKHDAGSKLAGERAKIMEKLLAIPRADIYHDVWPSDEILREPFRKDNDTEWARDAASAGGWASQKQLVAPK